MLASLKKSCDQPRQHIKKQRHYFANKGPCSQNDCFSSSHAWMWELDYKESWALKNWCFWTVVLEKTLESPLDCKEIQPVNPKGDQSWIFLGGTDAEAGTPILWPPDVKNWLIGKDPDAGKDWRQEGKGTTGWKGWMASPTRWTWVWVNYGSWWWTGRPGVLGRKVRHDRDWTIRGGADWLLRVGAESSPGARAPRLFPPHPGFRDPRTPAQKASQGRGPAPRRLRGTLGGRADGLGSSVWWPAARGAPRPSLFGAQRVWIAWSAAAPRRPRGRPGARGRAPTRWTL